MIRSKFNMTARFWPLFLVVMTPFLIISILSKGLSVLGNITDVLLCCLSIFLILILIVRLTTRLIYVEMSSDAIRLKPFLGYAKERLYDMSQIDGFHTTKIFGRMGSYKAVRIISHNKRIGTLSELYHSNYDELMLFCAKNLQYLGPV
jgi:hypothetical protein